MKTLIYQVCLTENDKPSKLYEHCIASVKRYADLIGADHIVQRKPILKIKPNPKTSNRSKEAVDRLGYLPIFEKENAFTYLDKYDKIAIIDADIYIRSSTIKNIFEEFDEPFAAMKEIDLPMKQWYKRKLEIYSLMQYARQGCNWKYSTLIAPFRNMGLMVFSKSILEYGQLKDPVAFIMQPKFQKFVDGIGNFKWSTDQTLLNDWIYSNKIPCHDLDWRWNCLYTTVEDNYLKEAKFVHFFLKDKLSQKGENVEQLMKLIGE